jgi:catechol 2,3-dioxygenase-like lactoylglutathione lyase family enzyme
MPSIRHVAIKCENPAVVADFYRDVFELKEVWRHNSNVYMSDGVFSLVLLKTREGEKPGINHFGFQVDDMEEMQRRLALAEVGPATTKPADGRYAEFGAADPEGNRVDLSVAGWATERDKPDD